MAHQLESLEISKDDQAYLDFLEGEELMMVGERDEYAIHTQKKTKFPLKTACFGLSLLLGGLVIIFLAFFVFSAHDLQHNQNGLALLILGLLCLIPGTYSTYVLFRAYRQHPGYRFTQVPMMD
eukprot:TRINITY_DN1212_c0_g1::TRINITY_DN1212_c0_g1_i1::g.26797::m.26797 TRINITY_DN1212_c0_g1::TRINITY_DN1212_c0_g1_i1::g.26797  ORF type:complete len:123 (+),score=1.50,DUF872/PF05915.7/4.4e-16,DUF3169/PF11368.3/0.0012,PIRT/PF15099.1/0.0031,DUF1469/PF07332.6/0.0041,SdpI/PF13630.1/0.017,VIT1/PF01988.14/0.018,DUF4199/PF13858.1/0.029 TRINITY_DN1212_c0_g1_i1:68-436(+)